MDYLAIAQSILETLPANEIAQSSELKPLQRKQQSDDDRIAEIAWARIKLIAQARSWRGPMMFLI